MSNECAQNTDVEIWRKKPDTYYSPSIRVTEDNNVKIIVGGLAITLPVEGWHSLAFNAGKDISWKE